MTEFLDEEDYQSEMQSPIEDLGIALWGMQGGPSFDGDWKLVEAAARKIVLMKKIILSLGFSSEILKTILDDV